MHRYLQLVCVLALARLSFTQTVQTRVTCLQDGQCVTETGEEAVCGKLDDFATARLPTVGGVGDQYVIRINLSEPLEEDPDQRPEEPSCDPTEELCPASPPEPPIQGSEGPTVPNDGNFFDVDPVQDVRLATSVNDNDRNPFLGGVGCTTRAFPRACQYCCFQTAIIQGSASLASAFSVNAEIGGADRDGDDECREENVLRLARSSSQEDCFRRASLGFRRTPTQRFFRECNRLSARFCAAPFRRCVDFRRR